MSVDQVELRGLALSNIDDTPAFVLKFTVQVVLPPASGLICRPNTFPVPVNAFLLFTSGTSLIIAGKKLIKTVLNLLPMSGDHSIELLTHLIHAVLLTWFGAIGIETPTGISVKGHVRRSSLLKKRSLLRAGQRNICNRISSANLTPGRYGHAKAEIACSPKISKSNWIPPHEPPQLRILIPSPEVRQSCLTIVIPPRESNLVPHSACS